MFNKWLIISPADNMDKYINTSNLVRIYSNYAIIAEDNESYKADGDNSKCILIDGYLLPRYKYYEELKSYSQFELLGYLYNKHGEKFIEYIKGSFVIVIAEENGFKIYTDHNGTKKVFYCDNGGRYVFSNSSLLVSEYIENKEISADTVGIKCLLNREIMGKTIIKNLNYLLPASIAQLNQNKVKFTNYWSPSHLLGMQNENNNLESLSEIVSGIVKQYAEYINPGHHVISLTGGKDSRTILAALLRNGIKPFGFTYGDPNSQDAVYAKKIALKLNMDHKIYTPIINAEWFETYSNKVICSDNPTINIHRSHRFYAFEKLQSELGSDVSYYAGYMGGEFMMGIYYDDLIFSKYLTSNWETGLDGEKTSYYREGFIRSTDSSEIDLKSDLSQLKCLDITITKKMRQFYSLFEIGIQHHVQDVSLSGRLIKYSIPFFMDIDFLELLFQSRYSFFYNDNKSKNLLNRYKLYEFNLNVQHILYPELDELPFAKKGSYNTKDYLKGKYYWSFMKALRYFAENRNYAQTFQYNLEYVIFLKKWLLQISNDKSSVIHNIYDIPKALKSLDESPIKTEEKYYHRYSNIVMHYMQSKYYKL